MIGWWGVGDFGTYKLGDVGDLCAQIDAVLDGVWDPSPSGRDTTLESHTYQDRMRRLIRTVLKVEL
jgi:hypothetical protein